MFYCWRLNAFLIADKPSSEPSKVGDFPPSVSFYRGVNSIEQERNALLLGRKGQAALRRGKSESRVLNGAGGHVPGASS